MDFWHFATPDPALGPPLTGSYNLPLVLLSIAIACFAGLAALSVVDRILASDDSRLRRYWLLAGAVAMGCGIWAMHFTGMLAFNPPITVSYGLAITLLSLIPAILGSGAAIHFMARPALGWKRLQLGALLLAAGIGTMHYTGMEAMYMTGTMHYDLGLFCLSLIVAHILAMAAIYVRFVLGNRLALDARWIRGLAAIIMGHAVAGMHYTAMAAADFYPAVTTGTAAGGQFSNITMGATISGFSVFILTVALLSTLIDRRIAQSEQRHLAEKLRADTILNTTADGILATNPQGVILSSNPAAESILGRTDKQMRGRSISQLIPGIEILIDEQTAAGARDGKATNTVGISNELNGVRADGTILSLELTINSMTTAGDRITVISIRDITGRKQTEETIKKTEERFRIVARTTTDAIWDWDLLKDTIWWSDGMQTLFGYNPEEIEPDSSSWTRRIHPDDRDPVVEDIHQAIEGTDDEWSSEYRFLRKDGSIAYVYDRGFIIRDDTGKAVRMVGGMADITERKLAEAEIQNLAFYDSLTQLPNRALLMDRLQHALATSHRTEQHGALLFIDLDDFKSLNDTHGHEVGDQFLQQIADRLQECIRESDTVARLGGDEFVVILESLSHRPNRAAAETEAVGEDILELFHQPFIHGDYEHHGTSSIGATLFYRHEHSVEELLKQADIAMYQAKAAGGNTLRFFDPEMQANISARVELEAELRKALNNEEFILHFQPQVGAGNNITAAEVLVRWQHPQRGLVPPLEFIPLAEDTGLILSLGQWILEAACRQLVAWETRGDTAGLDLAVNVSANQFRHPEFTDQVMAIINSTGANPARLKLELTENILVANMDDTVEKMATLKAEGIGFLLDDFGTGYSSLYYLKHLPIDQLKIDKSFIDDVLTDINDAAIARTIITLAQTLGLTVVAEGVETEAQRDFLEREGCHNYQGYLFSRPVPIEQFDRLVREQRS